MITVNVPKDSLLLLIKLPAKNAHKLVQNVIKQVNVLNVNQDMVVVCNCLIVAVGLDSMKITKEIANLVERNVLLVVIKTLA